MKALHIGQAQAPDRNNISVDPFAVITCCTCRSTSSLVSMTQMTAGLGATVQIPSALVSAVPRLFVRQRLDILARRGTVNSLVSLRGSACARPGQFQDIGLHQAFWAAATEHVENVVSVIFAAAAGGTELVGEVTHCQARRKHAKQATLSGE